MNLASKVNPEVVPVTESTRTTVDVNQIQLQLKQCKDLPSLPGVAFELLQQFRELEVDLKKTGEIIQKDPALTASVLRFANSPAFGVRREVTSVI